MTKQEKIQEEYLKLGLPFNENIVFDNGWLKIKPGLCSSRYDVLDLLKLTSNVHSVRPKSLHGIENNNGWIKIQSEDDLPNDIDGLWEVFINGEQKFIELLKDNKERLYKDFLKDGITHYKICNKSQPPLY